MVVVGEMGIIISSETWTKNIVAPLGKSLVGDMSKTITKLSERGVIGSVEIRRNGKNTN